MRRAAVLAIALLMVAASAEAKGPTGEPGHALNVRTILRDTQDGQWYRPSAAWAAALEKYLP